MLCLCIETLGIKSFYECGEEVKSESSSVGTMAYCGDRQKSEASILLGYAMQESGSLYVRACAWPREWECCATDGQSPDKQPIDQFAAPAMQQSMLLIGSAMRAKYASDREDV